MSEFEVTTADRRTTDKDARRFAVYMAERMLVDGEIEGRDVNERLANLAIIERGFYELALRDQISCSPIPKMQQEKRRKPDTSKWETINFRPCQMLKLHLEREQCADDCVQPHIEALYKKKLAELLTEEEDHEHRKRSRNDQGGSVRVARPVKKRAAGPVQKPRVPVRAGKPKPSSLPRIAGARVAAPAGAPAGQRELEW